MTSTIIEIGRSPGDDHPLCLERNAVLTWSDWRRDVDRLVAFLLRRSEARWGLYSTQSYDFSVGLFALWLSGRTPVIPPMNSPGTVRSLMENVDGLLGHFPLAELILRDPDDEPSDYTHRRIDPSAELVLFTSGSSGEPKAIHKRISQIDAEIATLESLWGADLDDAIAVATVSHQHIYGLLFKVLWPLAARRPFYTHTIRDSNAMVTLTARHHRSVWITSPAYLKRIPEHILDAIGADRDITLFSSGGPLATPVAHRIDHHLEQPPIEVYGSTETGGIAYRQQRSSDADTPWQPLPGVVIATNDEGRLLVRSPHLPDANWYFTGDHATRLSGASFHLGARTDRIVKVEEKRISLAAIEAALINIPGVKDAACIMHRRRRDTICAVVALDTSGYRDLYSSGRHQYTRRIRERLALQFERVTVPRSWRFVDNLPTNDQGKVSAADLIALFEPNRVQRLPDVVGSEYPTELEAILTLYVPKHLTYFDGHFPDTPVLPGVVQLLWVDHFARQLLGLEHGWKEMEAVKFNRLVLPDTTVTLRLEAREDGRRLQFAYAIDGTTCSSGRLVQGE